MSSQKIIGIILSSLGGLATMFFGYGAATVHQRWFVTASDEANAASTAYLLTAISIGVLIAGIVLISRGGKEN